MIILKMLSIIKSVKIKIDSNSVKIHRQYEHNNKLLLKVPTDAKLQAQKGPKNILTCD